MMKMMIMMVMTMIMGGKQADQLYTRVIQPIMDADGIDQFSRSVIRHHPSSSQLRRSDVNLDPLTYQKVTQTHYSTTDYIRLGFRDVIGLGLEAKSPKGRHSPVKLER